jgi:hypothetical protein
MLFPKTSSRVDGRQCAARHRLRSRKGSPGQHAGKNSTCRSPDPIWGTREWGFRHGSARLLEGLSQAVACLLIQLFPAISEREKIRYHQINRKTRNRIKYCKLDAVTGKPIRGAPPPITSERLQTGRTAPSIGSRSTRRSRSEPRARSPTVCARRAGLAGSWALRSPIRHQLDRSGNEGHGGPPQGGVQASTSGALQRIKRPAMNHIRFIRLKNFPDRL